MSNPPPKSKGLPALCLIGAIPVVLVARAEFAGVEPDVAPVTWREAAREHAPYLEDGNRGRVVARAEAIVERANRGEGARLRLVVRAVAPEIEAVRGYRGIAGGNHLTARELGRLLADPARFFVATRRVGSAEEPSRTTFTCTERAPLRERQLDRTVGVREAWSAEEFAIAVTAVAPVDGARAGAFESVVHARGDVRLVVRWSLTDDGGARVDAIDSHGADLFR